MFGEIHLPLVLAAAFVATASPGPATLALAGTSMAHGRKAGLALASGITTGSLTWSIAAACGLGALMLANAWVSEVIRYAGAAYLMYLSFKSARSALSSKELVPKASSGSARVLYSKGLALHLTNPKAIFFFGSLYGIGLPPSATVGQLATVVLAVGCLSATVFNGYALLFSLPPVVRFYTRIRRGFEALFAVGFGLAGLKVLTTPLRQGG